MRTTIDFDPLFRSSIGFDRMLNAIEAASRVAPFENWPPYDIVRSGEDSYRIKMAVAGFAEDDLTVTQERNVLVVSGRKDGEDEGEYLHRGIAVRSFERRFDLADHVRVEGASLTDGLLTITLRREVPEELKPRRIEIAGAEALPQQQTRQIETEQAAA